MRLESLQPKNESEFFTCIRTLTGGDFYYERVEPSNECGFPDVYFVCRDKSRRQPEGTIEIKYADTKHPNMRSLMRGTQKAALLDYYEAGGARRFGLAYCGGEAYLWDTSGLALAIREDGFGWNDYCSLASPEFRGWLKRMLTA